MENNVQVTMQLKLDSIVEALRFESIETTFEVIKQLEQSKQEFDLLEKCYLYFKEQYEKEKEFEDNK